MKSKHFVRAHSYWLITLFMTLLVSTAQAGTVTFGSTGEIGSSSSEVNGVWAFNESVTFSDSGRYNMTLADVGPSVFTVFRATLYEGSNKFIELLLSEDTPLSTDGFFDIDGGDYYLYLFAITDGATNFGAFEVTFDLLGGSSAVPIPASVVLLISALAALGAFVRRKTINSKIG